MKAMPRYLQEVVEEAVEYYEANDDVSRVTAAHEIAHQNESLVRMDEGRRDTLGVLADIRSVHSLCADEFETYRNQRDSSYTDSVLEAIALRSLEELINVSLDENQSFDNGSADYNREIEYINPDNSNITSNIQIHVTGKEAVDVDNALATLVDKAISHPASEAVSSFNHLWKGGVDGLADTTVMLTSAGDASILLAALREYDPDEADFTGRLRRATLEAVAASESHIDPDDVEPLTFDEAATAAH